MKSAARTPTVLVTDADRGSAVHIIRSLGRKGWRVIAADSSSRSLGFRSRYAAEHLVYPQPETAPDRVADVLYQAVVDKGVDFLIPVTDEIIHVLTHQRERFEKVCRLAVADTAALEQVTDKSRTLALAQELAVPVPATRVVSTPEEAREAAASLRWPVVLKPAVSRVYCPERGIIEKFSVSYADSLDSLVRRMEALSGHPVLLQEYCAGVGEGVELLVDRGRVVAAFQHRRLAEVPLTGGCSAWRESVPLSPELYAHASRLVEALKWTGLLMVEFRVGKDARDARLMEINGRVWGSLPLAVLSGMDFPSRLADLYFDGPPAQNGEPVSEYRVGVRAFHLELILNWIIRVLLGRNLYPFLSIPKRRQAVDALLGLLSPNQKLDLFSRDDMRPAVAECWKIVRKFGSRLALRRKKVRPPGKEPDHGA
jgi:predicted ATP-grasp superfamily ATP-dependent carboligase